MTNSELQKLRGLIFETCQNAKNAIPQLTECGYVTRQNVVLNYAELLTKNVDNIVAANDIDIKNAKSLSDAKKDRLILTKSSVLEIAKGVLEIAKQKDPINRILAEYSGKQGLKIYKVTQSIGLLGIIFESRPNVACDVACIAIMSGNAAILRGGSESVNSTKILVELFEKSLKNNSLSKDLVQVLPSQDYQAIDIMITQRGVIDLIIPRGGAKLVDRIIEKSKIPFLAHAKGLCHLYFEKSANIEKGVKIAVNAKMRRTSICGATETILIDKHIANLLLPQLFNNLVKLNCEVFVCQEGKKIVPKAKTATIKDWETEYLDAKVSIKIVDDINQAIQHISKYGSQHTDAIITENNEAFEMFASKLKSSIIMLNTSTQFADGGQFGFGGEIGISTQTMPPRGPVSVAELVSWKYIVESDYSCRK